MNLNKLTIAGVLLILAGYYFYPIMIGILHNIVGGVFTAIHNQIAMKSILMPQVIVTTIFLVPGIWLLVKSFKDRFML